MRALVVDDSKSMRLIVGRILQSCGFEVEHSEDGRKALDRFEANEQFALALVDWNMPVMTGIELIRAVRANPAWNETRLVMVTTEAESDRMCEALDAGADEYVMKPFSKEVLVGKLAARRPRGLSSMPAIRVLVVDDSVVVRKIVSDLLSADPDIEVVGSAPNGKIALAKILQCSPDLVTLDIEMPEMDGLTCVAEIRKLHPRLPVIMFSTLTERGATATLEALARGASDYVCKPAVSGGSAAEARARIQADLIPKIKSLARRPTEVGPQAAAATKLAPLRVAASRAPASRVEVLVIGTLDGRAQRARRDHAAAAPRPPRARGGGPAHATALHATTR